MQNTLRTHQSLCRVESIAPDANEAHVILAAFRETAIKEWRRRERKVSENSQKVDVMNWESKEIFQRTISTVANWLNF